MKIYNIVRRLIGWKDSYSETIILRAFTNKESAETWQTRRIELYDAGTVALSTNDDEKIQLAFLDIEAHGIPPVSLDIYMAERFYICETELYK